MTVEELLKPRYEVIADYPGNTYYPVGKTITVITEMYAVNDNGKPVFWCNFNEFPHLFRPLAWYEKRSVDEMPEYVKAIKDSGKNFYKKGDVIKVRNWHTNNNGIFWLVNFICVPNEHTKYHFVSDFLPATETEYNNHNKVKDNE